MTRTTNDSAPLYLQLKSALAERIATGKVQPHDRLPSERQLCEQFNISRMTVRQALKELAQEGLIYTYPGKGSFVAERRAGMEVAVSLSGFTSDVRRMGAEPSSRILEAALVSPDPSLVKALHLTGPEDVVKLERLRLVNNVPLAVHTAYLPHRLCPGILRHDLAEESLFTILRQEYNLKPAHAEQNIWAALAKISELKLLELSYPAAVLKARRTTCLKDGTVIEYSESIYRGERYQMHLELEAVG